MAMDKDTLGQAMYDAVHSITVDENTTTDGNIGLSRMKAMAEAIINHISANATIASLSTTSTPAGTGPHTHLPFTVSASGKIS